MKRLPSYMRNEIYLDFVVADFEDITHDEISQRLGMNPRKVYVKGAKKHPDSHAETLIKRSRWLIGSSLGKHLTFEEHLNAMLDLLEPKIDLLKPLCEKYNCFFSCAVFIDTDDSVSTPSLYLNWRYNKLTRELKLDFDFDLYCLPQKTDS